MNVATCSANKQHYVRDWKTRWNSQGHCCFVVTSLREAVLVATVTWYTYPLHYWNPSNCSFPQMTRDDHKPRSHVLSCDHTFVTITYAWLLTEVKKWGKFGLTNSSHAVIIFFPYLKVQFNFKPFCDLNFGSLIHMGPQMAYGPYMWLHCTKS